MTKKLIILTAVGLLLISMNLNARPAGRDRDMMRHARFGIFMAENNLFPARMLLKFKDDIGLTREQLGKIEKMQELIHEATIRREADIKIKELKLQSYLKNEPVNRKEMEKMIGEIAKMKTDQQIDHMNYLLDLREVLTPEQVGKIETLKKEKFHRVMENRRPWRERMQQRQQERQR